MSNVTLNPDGRAAIPAKIQEYLQVRPGDEIDSMIDPDGRVVVRPARIPVTMLHGCVPKPARPASLEEMEEAIASGMVGEEEK
jgi:antitoxin PrlF